MTTTLTVQPIDTFIHYGITCYQVLRYELALVENMGLNLVIGYAWYVMICNHYNAVRGKYISSKFTKRMSSTRTCNARNLTCYVFTAMSIMCTVYRNGSQYSVFMDINCIY